jgi:hypothetical protein
MSAVQVLFRPRLLSAEGFSAGHFLLQRGSDLADFLCSYN